MNKEYKEIIISYDKNLSYKDIQSINIFNDFYKENEIRLQSDFNRVVILLREIDFFDVKKRANSLKGNTDNKSLFDDLIFNIESIKSYGLSGTRRNYADYNKERKVKNRATKVKKRGKHYYAKNNNFSKENNLLPQDFINQIVCGNSLEELKKLPDNCIDIIFTSPPYNFGIDYQENQDDHQWQDYFSKLFEIFKECIRVLKYGGRFIINIQPLFSDYIPSHHMISNFFISQKMIWKGEILWEKNNYNCKYTAWGSWKSPSNPYLKYTWEFVEVFSKGDLKKVGDKNNIDITAEEFKSSVVAKWSIAPERDMKKYNHPAMFPERLVEKVLKLFSFKDDIVLDPFNGVGTTTYVAKKYNRKFLGIDISKEYCKTAKNRMKKILETQSLF